VQVHARPIDTRHASFVLIGLGLATLLALVLVLAPARIHGR
jgi:hypothetical protein